MGSAPTSPTHPRPSVVGPNQPPPLQRVLPSKVTPATPVGGPPRQQSIPPIFTRQSSQVSGLPRLSLVRGRREGEGRGGGGGQGGEGEAKGRGEGGKGEGRGRGTGRGGGGKGEGRGRQRGGEGRGRGGEERGRGRGRQRRRKETRRGRDAVCTTGSFATPSCLHSPAHLMLPASHFSQSLDLIQ